MNARENVDAAATPASAAEPAAAKQPQKPKQERRTTAEQIAEAEQLLARLKDKQRREQQLAREEHERELRKLLKANELDDFSIAAWTTAAPKIKQLLEAASKAGVDGKASKG